MANITTPIYIYDRDEQLRLILNNLPGNFDGLAVSEQNRNLTQIAGMFIGTMEAPRKQPIPQSDSGFLPYKNGWITEQLNGAVTLQFDVFANHPSAALIVNDGRAVTTDIDGNYMEFIIRVIDDDYGSSGTFKHVEAESSEYELIDEFLPEYEQASVDLETALKAVTQGTRIDIGDVDNLGKKPVSLKNMSVKKAVYELLNLFGAERRLRVEIAGNRITRRYIDALEHRGQNTGKRWEAGKDIISSTRTINSETVKTALYGRGSSQENDQPRLTFSDVEWIKANGDPTDKPLGQTWVGDVDALHNWGYEHGTRHKLGFYDGQEDDPGVLLFNTWNELQKIVRTKDTYDVTAIQLGEILDYEHEKVRLGDISYAINREIYPEMETESSVIEFRHNLNQSDKSECTLGMFRAEYDLSGRFNNVEKDHNENRGNWNKKETPAAAQEKADVAKSDAITEAQVRIDDAKIKLDADITNAENRITQAEADLDTAEQDLLAAQNRLDTNDTEIGNAETEIDNAKTNIGNLETDLGNAKTDLQTKISEAEAAAKTYTNSQLTNYVDTTLYDNDLSSIQAQIDNQITSYFKDYAPSLTNEPASLWTDNTEKDKHIGDLFYNSSTGYSYRFMLDNTVYKWTLVRDEGIAKALQDAAQAQDTADGKRRTFVAQPTTPYDKGDLWVDETNGKPKVYSSLVTKTTSATFSQVDWELIGDVTGENTANDTDNVGGRPSSDIEDVQGAQAKADTAEGNAKGYTDEKVYRYPNNAYDSPDDASIYSPKPSVAVMQSTTWSGSGSSYGTLTTYWSDTDRANQYYVDSGGNSFSREVHPATYPAWSSWKETEDINGAQAKADTAEQSAKAYAVAEAVYNTKMTEIATDLGGKAGLDYVDGELVRAISDIDIGGRNIILSSNKKVDNSSYPNTTYTLSETTTIGTTYTYQIKGTLSEDQTAWLFYGMDGNSFGAIYGEEKHDIESGIYYGTFQATRAVNAIKIYGYPNSNFNSIIDWIQLEKGNKATSRQPAPEDVQAYADAVALAKANLAETQAKAYADNIVTVEEQARIDQAKADLAEAKAHADTNAATKADKLTTYTITEVDNALNNYVGVTEYQTDQDGVVQTLDSHGTRLGQNETAIGLKASQTDLNTVKGTVSDNSAELTVQAGKIESKVDSAYVSGAIGGIENYLEFDGVDDYVEIPQAAAQLVHGGLEATIEFWVRKDDLSYGLIQLSGYADVNGILYPYREYDAVYLDVFKTSRTVRIYLDSDVRKWHHFAVSTKPGLNGWNFYQNGKLMHQIDGESTVATDYLGFIIGRNSSSRYGNGAFRDVRLWNVARTQQEIKNNMYAILLGTETGLVGYWKFDEGTGNVVNDLVNGNDGTIYSATWNGINPINATLSDHSTAITQTAAKVETKAESSVVNALTGRVDTAESTITQQSDEIALKVNKDGVIAAIGLSSEGVRIKGKDITLDGDTLITGTLGASTATILDLTTKRMTTIDAKIESATISGTLNANNATFNDGTFNSAVINFMTANYGTIIDATMQDATVEGNITATNATFLNATINDATINNATITGNLVGVTGTFTGELSGGSITSNTDISVTTDLRVGDNIYLGSQGDTGSKTIHFSVGADITSSPYGLLVNSPAINMYSYEGDASLNKSPEGIQLEFSRDRIKSNVYQDNNDNNRLKIESSGAQVWLDPNGTVYFRNNGASTHVFYSDGGKLGGSIVLDEKRIGMSPTDSPQSLIEYVVFEKEITETGVEIMLDARFVKATTNYAIFPSQGKVIDKQTDRFTLVGTGQADIRIVGLRYDRKDQFWVDMEAV